MVADTLLVNQSPLINLVNTPIKSSSKSLTLILHKILLIDFAASSLTAPSSTVHSDSSGLIILITFALPPM